MSELQTQVEPNGLADVIILPLSNSECNRPSTFDATIITMRLPHPSAAKTETNESHRLDTEALTQEQYMRIATLTSEFRRSGQSGVAHYLTYYAANRMRNHAPDESFETIFTELVGLKEWYRQLANAERVRQHIARVGIEYVSDDN